MRLLTPQDIRSAPLDTTRLREGYDIDEVDDLLDQCAFTVQVLTQTLKDTTRRLRPLGEQLNNARTEPTKEEK
ncbi:MAG: DivIVA domain-containing protein [Bifidobacterium thermophilum]|nr:DivIVA domain-containing protein [Bifidobacterium thermophilum]